jgi:hypothetical protein
MINADRIVPVTATDLITLYALILKQDATNNSTLAKLNADTIDGAFQIKSGSAPLIATEPVRVCDIDATASSVSACTLYFIPAFDYEGFTIDGAKVTPTGTVVADGNTLYKAVLATGAITISNVGL